MSTTSSSARPTPPPSSSSSSRAGVPSVMSRSVEEYRREEKIGVGTYGEVYRARNLQTNEMVALKRVRMDSTRILHRIVTLSLTAHGRCGRTLSRADEKQGFPVTAIREIKLLQRLKHPNIVNLIEIVTASEQERRTLPDKGGIYMVLEYMEHDLAGLTMIAQAKYGGFSRDQMRWYAYQLFSALFYCHRNSVLHRDLKTSNVLVNNRGDLKLADFGLARAYNPNVAGEYTNCVITLWYRPIELLLGAKNYGPAIDMWSAGCIVGELLLRKPLMPGATEQEQLSRIYNMCGTPDVKEWPECEKLPLWDTMRPRQREQPRVRQLFNHADLYLQDLMGKLLCLNPKKRMTAKEALDHDYFYKPKKVERPNHLVQYPSSHEYTTKKRKQADAQRKGGVKLPKP